MADLEFNRDDIVSLIEKVSSLQPHFSTQELQLLMSIFALAAEHTVPTDTPQVAMLPEATAPGQQAGGTEPATVDELQQQLLQAYIPGSSFDSVTGDDELTVSHSIHRHSIHRTSSSIHRTSSSIHRTGSIHQDVEPPEEG
jgi:hypothetical protein